MFQQKDNENLASENTVFKNQKSQNNARKTEPTPFSETEVEENKSFSERWKTNRFWLVRGLYYVLQTVWMIVMFIGGFIAWLISLLFI